MKNLRPLFLVCLGFLSFNLQAQTQVVKGTIIDQQAEYPIIGASIIVANSEPLIGTVTDLEGNFRLEKVPVGRQTLIVQYVGYKSITLPNVLVTSGKEVVLNVKLEESVEKLDEIVITADANKDLPLNDLAKVSGRTFNLEETLRFSGGRNDVARLATSFAGVSAPDDSRNDIVVRGNSPTGLLWRIEGIPMPNTNHFAAFGTTGGPVNALNPNLLATSDFLTGAFPAEYGNATSAVFDVGFRDGNKDKFEFTGQLAAFSGLEFMAEGPVFKETGGSFIASYRYGIASLAATGTSATPFFQDFSFKLNSGNTKSGKWELFGLGGISNIDFLGDEIEEDDLFANPNEDAFVENGLGLIGLSNTIKLNKTTFLKTTVGVNYNSSDFDQDNLFRSEPNGPITGKYRATESEQQENRLTLSSTLNKKFNAKWSLTTGFLNETYDLKIDTKNADNRNLADEGLDNNNDGIPDLLPQVLFVDDQYNLTQVFAQAENNITDDLSLTFGLHGQYLDYTEDFIAEPRIGLSWQARPNQRWSVGYGLHSQVVPGPVLFYTEFDPANNTFERTNDELDFIKSHHFVLAYDRNLGTDWRLKAEAYYQSLFDVPVESTPSSYSVINEGSDFEFREKGNLVNDGTGFNTGVELTIEKFFSKGYYLLSTASVFNSKYEGSDGVERNTAYNGNYVYNLLLGKEWKFGPGGKNAWTFDTKFTTAGGRPYTQINLQETINNGGREVFNENRAYEESLADYVRWDVKFGVRLNSKNKNISHQFFVDLQNVLGIENEFTRRYNEVTGRVDVVEQNGFFPDVMYRIQF
ncbi:TonB-dependent receptor [Fulvivirga lutea]|uniref:TonB-dependent receptor n=1 Tax=Fulvivirga lutea TaxID=2810512 RepID=A0A974WFL4_9BACT|nr:TonB-dependent receptor [Fulvivirga lutea]QSE97336.1 TonB-dependent receptor [Fulvivirga lutea]